jgi:HAD superfamily hydrolase (TIGR01509 family)
VDGAGRHDEASRVAPLEQRVSDLFDGRIEAVIFDLDGVIVDSEIWWDEVRQRFAAERDRRWTEEDRLAVMGANSRGWRRIMRERLALEEPEEGIERAIVGGVVTRFAEEGPPIIEGAAEAVRRIADSWPVAIASSAHRDVIDAALRSVGLTEHLPVVVSSDEVEHGKPDPDVYLEAARRLSVEPERCLVVEDSYNGVRAARAAGMTVVLVPNRSIPPADGTHELADIVLESLADLDPAAVRPSVRD